MAAASVQALSEEATCPLCLNSFQDPVVTECGHSFCRACVDRCWEVAEGPEEGETATCPECREEVRRTLVPIRRLAGSEEGAGGVCAEHQEPPALFCEDDGAFLCASCDPSEQHPRHDVVPPEAAAQHYKELLLGYLQVLEKERTTSLDNKARMVEKNPVFLKQIREELEKTKRLTGGTRAILDQLDKDLEDEVTGLEQAAVEERDAKLDVFSRDISSHGALMQEMEQKLQQPPVELLQGIRNILERYERREPTLIFNLDALNDFIPIYECNLALDMKMKKFRAAAELDTTVVYENVALDPRTAHSLLVVPEECKSVIRLEGGSQDETDDNPERLLRKFYVLGHGIEKRGGCTWGVSFEGEGFGAVGVARRSVQRKSRISLSTDHGIWAVGRWPGGWGASDRPNKYFLPLNEASMRIRVYLNEELGELAFFDEVGGVRLYSFSGADFRGEALQPFFYVGKGSSLTVIHTHGTPDT